MAPELLLTGQTQQTADEPICDVCGKRIRKGGPLSPWHGQRPCRVLREVEGEAAEGGAAESLAQWPRTAYFVIGVSWVSAAHAACCTARHGVSWKLNT
jgi:hypothetical protein